MSLERAELVCEDKKRLSFVFQFNPTSFTLERSVNWAEQSPAVQAHTMLQYGNGNTDTLTVSLLLDTSEQEESVLPMIRRFYDLTLPYVIPLQMTARPPYVSMTWQAFRFKGVVANLNFEVLAFDHDGHPKRATVTMTLKGEAFPGADGPLGVLLF